MHTKMFKTARKTVKVISLPKTKPIFICLNNYRPVSILMVLTKPIKRHAHKRLTDLLETRHFFHYFQCGFRC